jgi:hypothetical protein
MLLIRSAVIGLCSTAYIQGWKHFYRSSCQSMTASPYNSAVGLASTTDSSLILLIWTVAFGPERHPNGRVVRTSSHGLTTRTRPFGCRSGPNATVQIRRINEESVVLAKPRCIWHCMDEIKETAVTFSRTRGIWARTTSKRPSCKD